LRRRILDPRTLPHSGPAALGQIAHNFAYLFVPNRFEADRLMLSPDSPYSLATMKSTIFDSDCICPMI
jgi:hypothetical protein